MNTNLLKFLFKKRRIKKLETFCPCEERSIRRHMPRAGRAKLYTEVGALNWSRIPTRPEPLSLCLSILFVLVWGLEATRPYWLLKQPRRIRQRWPRRNRRKETKTLTWMKQQRLTLLKPQIFAYPNNCRSSLNRMKKVLVMR